MKLKKGDQIIVLAGKDKGKKGKVDKVFPGLGKVLVGGVNLYKKHTKSKGAQKPGGIMDITKPLAASSVAVVCPKCNQPTRVGYQLAKDGSKTRICRKCQEVI